MRLFVAAELPDDIREQLLAAAPAQPPWRRVREEALHATLAFLGERPEADVPRIAGALALRARPPVVQLGETLLLPPRRPRVCAVRLDGTLDVLAHKVVSALVGIGVLHREARPFLAHVTVARCRGRPVPARVEVSGRFAIASFALFASRPGPGGARYTPLHRTTLR